MLQAKDMELLYLRYEYDQGVNVELVLAKSKVTSLKSISFPRLTLLASVTLSRFIKFYTASICEKLGNVFPRFGGVAQLGRHKIRKIGLLRFLLEFPLKKV